MELSEPNLVRGINRYRSVSKSSRGVGQTAEELMSILERRFRKSLQKRMKRGFRGYPVATVAYYGPDDQHASKVAVGIVRGEGEEPAELRRWSSADADVRLQDVINRQIAEFISAEGARTVAGVDRIIGCSHEEGIDYPQGAACPACSFWANRDRWTGKTTH